MGQENSILKKELGYLGLIKFALPSVIMMAFISLYTIIDGMFISNFGGDNALTSMNLVFPVIAIINGFSFMFSVGGCALVSKMLGENKAKEANSTFTSIFIVALMFNIFLSLICIILKDPIFNLLGVDEVTYDNCTDYYVILLSGSFLMLIQSFFQTYYVADGKIYLGFILSVFGGLINVLFDYIFMVVLKYGVAGAAYATIIGYIFAGLPGLLFFILKKKGLRLTKPTIKFKDIFKTTLNGSSELISNISNAIITLIYNSIMLNLIGHNGVAGIAAIQYAQFLFTSIFFGFSIGVAPIISYHFGAKNTIYLKKTIKRCAIICLTAGIVMNISSLSLAQPIGKLFAAGNEEVYTIINKGMIICSFSFLISGLNLFSSACYTALNDGVRSAIISFSRTLVFSIGFTYLLSYFFKDTGLFLSMVITEISTLLVVLIIILINKYLKRNKNTIDDISIDNQKELK